MKAFAQAALKSFKLPNNVQRFCSDSTKTAQTNFEKIIANNKQWAADSIKNEPDFFKKLVDVQKPKYLWIGCSDSRVPAN